MFSPHEISAMFGLFKKKQQPSPYPPVPDWKPEVARPIERIIECFRFYANGSRDFAVIYRGTVAILPNGLSDAESEKHAKQALYYVFPWHLGMNPLNMKDGISLFSTTMMWQVSYCPALRMSTGLRLAKSFPGFPADRRPCPAPV